MRACVQCGLSVSESATFCAVCGARFDTPELESLEESGSPAGPDDPADPAGPDEPAEQAADPDETEVEAGVEADGPQIEAGRHDVESGEPDVQTPAPDVATDKPQVEEPEVDPMERRLSEVSALLDDAARTEESDAGRAAALYGDAIVACLDATEDPLGSEDVRPVLLRSFDRLSSLLERGGLAEEALAVVDDAASLGLLNGGDEARTPQRDSLEDRRENLRRTLFADWAQL